MTRASTSCATSPQPPIIVRTGIIRHGTGSPNIQRACVRTNSKVPTPHATSSQCRFPSCPTSKSRSSIDLRCSPRVTSISGYSSREFHSWRDPGRPLVPLPGPLSSGPRSHGGCWTCAGEDGGEGGREDGREAWRLDRLNSLGKLRKRLGGCGAAPSGSPGSSSPLTAFSHFHDKTGDLVSEGS
ncbi:hypothetical protein Naga_100290g3 [Nannochloropsis gaditana]|uniref:Uncharacterized protein n=1 Tax=Nannochloropsis gaditana TaxID=72520 RepID=W7TQ68_9STRA|nr:hypothetical protein Naga_100290g3 [Nannochloropsis gaditana]